MKRIATIEFTGVNRLAEAAPGSTLLDALRAARIEIPADCGGHGTCGKCMVRAEGGLDLPTEQEKKILGDEKLSLHLRLACRARATGNVKVEFVGAAVTSEILPFRMEYVPNPKVRTDLVAKKKAGLTLGASVDIGTTSLSARLADLETGLVIASVITPNPQRLYGADVASRINYAADAEGGLERLRSLIVGRVREMLDELARGQGADSSGIGRIVVAGNPAMVHIFLGIEPRFIAPAPFVAPTACPLDVDAAAAGLRVAPGARILILPAVAAYVGADAVAGALRVWLHEPGGPRLFVDLGTNAEIMLSDGDRIYSCAAAAGPALEGAQIACGTRASDGAIDSVSFDTAPFFTTISGAPPEGICGTGILDAVAALLAAGVISANGRMESETSERLAGTISERIREREGVREFVIARGGERGAKSDIALTQRDVREIQLAKGAIRAGIEILLDRTGVAATDLETIYLAGALGTYLKPETALGIGLVPVVDPQRIKFVGNAALDGATEALLSSARWTEAAAVAETAEYIELSSDPEFEKRFTTCMKFPDK